MAPVAVATTPTATPVDVIKAGVGALNLGVEAADLSVYGQFNNTPATGTEFRVAPTKGDTRPALTIKEVLADDAKLKALGRLVSERGVVFFREAEITPDEQKVLVDKLGKFGGKPADSTLHIHPLTLPGSQHGDEISVISNQFVFDGKFKLDEKTPLKRVRGAQQWHSDITFENVPSDYASLVIRTLPQVGGDTLWASAYEAYDRLSAPTQKYLEGLTAVHKGQVFLDLASKLKVEVREHRGSPQNIGQDLETIHPVVRTNPVTGWKGLFVNRGFTKRIVELSPSESDAILEFLFDHVAANHDIQVRFRWEENSLAIWDNRSSFHAATQDVDGVTREGTRSVSIGERPYFDPASKSRRADLGARALA
ncbi:Putative alpha-ketoglutarate-dependent sulfonate dioxygenase [Vanrija pseudolonga]|uniref:Alpha-ketoglutarate-dependent sulfonate dioxygenase n=1 Tax=Vanrija pseudolonga TaxID=143232 RepID=A0AAF1BNA0_9TREE|nr:Putative alpha-ketoglutarate-dependent sulfonate dioxygenase [Vanrija pseudolonga]